MVSSVLCRLKHESSRPPESISFSALFWPWQTRPQATVEVEISEDMQLVHFDFGRCASA